MLGLPTGTDLRNLLVKLTLNFWSVPQSAPTPLVLFLLSLHCAHCQGTAVPSSHDQSTTPEPVKQSALPAEGCGGPEKHLHMERVQWHIPPHRLGHELKGAGRVPTTSQLTQATGATGNQRTCIFYIWL